MPQSKQASWVWGVLPQAGETKLVLFGGGYENVNYIIIKDAEANLRHQQQLGEFTVFLVGMQAKGRKSLHRLQSAATYVNHIRLPL
jgi:hypothetical protein